MSSHAKRLWETELENFCATYDIPVRRFCSLYYHPEKLPTQFLNRLGTQHLRLSGVQVETATRDADKFFGSGSYPFVSNEVGVQNEISSFVESSFVLVIEEAVKRTNDREALKEDLVDLMNQMRMSFKNNILRAFRLLDVSDKFYIEIFLKHLVKTKPPVAWPSSLSDEKYVRKRFRASAEKAAGYILELSGDKAQDFRYSYYCGQIKGWYGLANIGAFTKQDGLDTTYESIDRLLIYNRGFWGFVGYHVVWSWSKS